ncbi:MAG: hypothetical protein OQK24_10640 [Magnetovibrio sp.]|nr:hypothetical protein [Magnetovibrio sp.]
MTSSQDTLQKAIHVHGQLSQLLNPVTPSSIRGSSFIKNPTLIFIALVVLASFLTLLAAPIGTDEVVTDAAKAVTDTAKTTKTANGLFLLGILGAAALGSAFYALTSAAPYIKQATFEPQYNQIYLLRLVIGICAGIILGLFANELNIISSDIGQRGLALVGGFSAEAVVQILKRIAETLVTAVRGSDKDYVKTAADKELMKKKMEIGNNLQDALSKPDTEKQAAIQDIIKNLSK